MNERPYPFELSRHEFRYEFFSVSAKKSVKKIVLLSQTEESIIFNVALLDVLVDGSYCDISTTNNNDMRTVMATVIKIISSFFNKCPEDYVMFRGSDARRDRLYRIIISREFKELSKDFKILGVKNGVPFPFAANQDIDHFLIRKL